LRSLNQAGHHEHERIPPTFRKQLAAKGVSEAHASINRMLGI
jgi:hypothetical protein